MTFNSNADVSGSGAKRRGPGGGVIAGGVGGLGAIAVILLQLFTGGDFTSLLTGGGSAAPAQETEIQNCLTGADANASVECRLVAGSKVINDYWAGLVDGYRQPQLIIVDRSTPSACGTASNATGPFYCPPEETVYIDPTFFDVLAQQFGDEAGDLAQLYVLAHEYGHHIQQLTGVFDSYPNDGSTGPSSNSVRTELQADCYAGAWVADAAEQTDEHGVAYLKAPTEDQIRDALDAAAAVGDDHIQAQSGGVNPESWTHGSSAQRQRWFTNGYEGGPGACDTFSVSGDQL